MVNKIISEQLESEDSYYKISNDEYLEMMKLSDYHGKGISKLPKFKGKPLWIVGSVDLEKTSTDSLGNVGYVEGNLNISRTNISDLGNTKVKGYISSYGTPLERKRIAAIQRGKLNEMDEYRESDEWNLSNPNIDDLGIKANALFKYMVYNRYLDSLDDKEKEKISQNKIEIEKLQTEKDNLSMDDENWNEKDDELQEQIDNLQEEIDDLISDKSDIYVLYPARKQYGLQKFENLASKDEEYIVGNEDEMDDAVMDYAKSYIDDIGIDGFSQGFLQDYIDTDKLKEYFEDWWRDDIYQNPESYFSDSDFELTPEQEKRISDIESEIEDYETQQNELDPEQEDYGELYDDFQKLIDDLETEKDDIVPNTEPTDEMIEDVLEDRLRDLENNPNYYIKEFGMDLKQFIDEDELAKGLVASDGYGIMNSYDGTYDTENINGDTYYIMRIN